MNARHETIGRNTAAGDQLKSLVERIERLTEEKDTIAADIREVYAEAKAHGFDTKVMRQVIRIRAQDPADRQEEEAIRDLYLHALGMTPMEEHISKAAAAARDFVETVAENGGGSVTVGDTKVDIPAEAKRKKAKAEAAP